MIYVSVQVSKVYALYVTNYYL